MGELAARKRLERPLCGSRPHGLPITPPRRGAGTENRTPITALRMRCTAVVRYRLDDSSPTFWFAGPSLDVVARARLELAFSVLKGPRAWPLHQRALREGASGWTRTTDRRFKGALLLTAELRRHGEWGRSRTSVAHHAQLFYGQPGLTDRRDPLMVPCTHAR